jgi:hypothetical protein
MPSFFETIVPPSAVPQRGDVPSLLSGDVRVLQSWLNGLESRRVLWCVGVIVSGAGLYGAAIGCWRSPEQALFTAIKFPLILLLTTLGNALLNGFLAPLLGLNLTLRQSALAILLSYALAAVILAAFAPLVFFAVWNLPPMSVEAAQARSFSLLQVSQVAVIAFAGIVANVRLLQLLRQLGGQGAVARRVLFGWLAGNLLLGTQLTWIFRPFFGWPSLPVQFLRSDAFHGNFFETVLRNATSFFVK